MNWLTNLFKRKKQDTVKKTEGVNITPLPIGKVYYSDYTPTGRTEEIRYVDSSTNTNNNGDFFLSLLAAEATDSAAVGMMVGGDITGAVIGDMLSDSNQSNDYGSSNDSSPSYDYGSSNSDPGPSYDSGSSFGSDSSSFSSDSGGW